MTFNSIVLVIDIRAIMLSFTSIKHSSTYGTYPLHNLKIK